MAVVTDQKPTVPNADEARRSALTSLDRRSREIFKRIVDCDVIQADGGTRTAAITGGWVALFDCFAWMKARDMLRGEPLRDHVAAISCGIYQGQPVLDLDYREDSEAQTDANFVMTGSGGIVEIQGTAEGAPFSEEELARLLALARAGIRRLIDLQKLAVD